MMYAVHVIQLLMMYFLSFMKIDTGVQAVLRTRLCNLNGCNVGITDRSDICIAPLRWTKVA
jgi:hypothetical protein